MERTAALLLITITSLSLAWQGEGLLRRPEDPATVARPDIRPTAGRSDGIWIGHEELQALPATGPAWTSLTEAASQTCSAPRLSDQDDPANVCVLAKALVFARLGTPSLLADVLSSLRSIAAGETYRGRALALGRKLVAYIIAADLIDLEHVDPGVDAAFRATLSRLLTTPTDGGPRTLIECHEKRPNNWGTQCGASRAAAAAYLDDGVELARVAQVFKGWLGDRESYSGFSFGNLSWQCDPSRPVGVNAPGCMRNGHSLDGVVPDDQRRGGTFQWPPPKENYVYGALGGALIQAVILHRAGYEAFEWQHRALQRAFGWLHREASYPAEGDDLWEIHVVNHFYGTNYPAPVPARAGKNVGWTDWSHARHEDQSR